MRYKTLSVVISFLLFSEYCYAGTSNKILQCSLNFTHPDEKQLTQGNILIKANQLQIEYPNLATYTGNVSIANDKSLITTEELDFERSTGKISLPKNFIYADPNIKVTGKYGEFNFNNRFGVFNSLKYQFNEAGQGVASRAEISTSERVLFDTSFTTCVQGDDSWHFEAKKVVQYPKEGYAKIWGAWFKIKNIPILYLPYLEFPLDDRRRSGLLIPYFDYNESLGFVWSQPYYFNLAPNYDLTVTSNIFSKKGLGVESEFRYLSNKNKGKIFGQYLVLPRKKYQKFKNRYLINFENTTNFNPNWKLKLYSQNLSDADYAKDFAIGGVGIQQNISLSYVNDNFDLLLEAENHKNPFNVKSGYRILPSLYSNFYYDFNRLKFHLLSKAVRFEDLAKKGQKVTKFHLVPSLNLPIDSKFGNWQLGSKFYLSKFEVRDNLSKITNRFVPEFTASFDDLKILSNKIKKDYQISLEPQFLYVYRPYNQTNLANLKYSDSTRLTPSYSNLFNERIFSGLDEIANSNMLTFGTKARFSIKEKEFAYLGLAQRNFLRKSNSNKFVRAVSFAVKPNEQILLKANYQYSPKNKQNNTFNTILSYKTNKKLVQLSYRYLSKDFINLYFPKKEQKIEQLGIKLGLNLNDYWTMTTSYVQNLTLNKTQSTRFGLSYTSCCWKVNFYYMLELESTKINKSESFNHKFNKNFGFNFEFVVGGKGPTDDLNYQLSQGLFPLTEYSYE